MRKINIRQTHLLLFSLTLSLLLFHNAVFAQPASSPAAERMNGFEQRTALKKASILSSIKAENIGPSIFSCRVTDVDVNPADPSEMYVAYASGGLWYSHNNGTRFQPVFDHEASMTIGDIAVN